MRPQRDQKAAVAVAVGVGSFSDPPQLGGLAHFLEHMLFMGSSKYVAVLAGVGGGGATSRVKTLSMHIGGSGSDARDTPSSAPHRYPSENEYDSYLSDHGGYSNAYVT